MKTDPTLAPYYLTVIALLLLAAFLADRLWEGRHFWQWRVVALIPCLEAVFLLWDWHMQVLAYRAGLEIPEEMKNSLASWSWDPSPLGVAIAIIILWGPCAWIVWRKNQSY